MRNYHNYNFNKGYLFEKNNLASISSKDYKSIHACPLAVHEGE